MTVQYKQRVRRALRRGEPIPPVPAEAAPAESGPTLIQEVEAALNECAEHHRREIERLEGVSVSEIVAALQAFRRSYRQTLASACKRITDRIHTEEQRHATELAQAVRRTYQETADGIREAEERHARELHEATRLVTAPQVPHHPKPRPVRQDYPCVYRGNTPLTKKEKALFLDCRSCGPPVFRCNHPDFTDVPHSPAQYCTVYTSSRNRDVSLCRRCDLRKTSEGETS
jgi:rubrerythrin